MTSTARFAVLYFVHALYWREGLSYMGGLWSRRGCGGRLLLEVLQGIFIVWGLAILAVAWCIGVSRYRDNRHNIDDILVCVCAYKRGRRRGEKTCAVRCSVCA